MLKDRSSKGPASIQYSDSGCWPWPPLLALPPLLTGRSIPVRGERRGEERSCNKEVEGEGRGGRWLGRSSHPPGPDAAAAAHIAIIEEEAEREREAALTWEREGMIQLLIFGPMGELYFKALD